MQQNNAGFSRWVSFSTSATSNEEPSDSDVLRLSAGRRDSVTVLAHSFKMKLDSFADEIFDLVEGFARCAKARQIGSVGPPSAVRFLVNDQVFHFSPACLRILFNVPAECLLTDDRR